MIHIFIAPIIVVIITYFIFSKAQKEARKSKMAMDANDFVVRQPKTSLKLHIFGTVFFF